MSEVAGLITASVGLLGALGVAIKWLWDKIEKRFLSIEEALAECKDREVASQDRRAKRDTVIELLIQAIKSLHPDTWRHPSLEGAKALLDEMRNEGKP